MREVDYLVIGSGIAGMTFRHHISSDSVAVVDPQPGKYKIGESIVPPHFYPPALRPLLAKARKLPSATAKHGTLFVSEEGLSFFHAYYDASYTIHLDRQELEQLYRSHFGIDVIEERVDDIDLDSMTVKTDRGELHVRKQIVDASGPAMVLARHLGLAYEIWPVYASWAYWDVQQTHDQRLWQSAEDKGLAYWRFDDTTERLQSATIDRSLQPSRMTMLTRLRDGVWIWQIPLYDAKRLSLGVVSRHGPVSQEQYLAVAREALGPQYEASLRPWDRSSPHNSFHVRNRFAWASRQFADPRWALIGDSAFFGDPIYSVGTGIATNQAIRAAMLMNRFNWQDGAHKLFERHTASIFERAKRAYNHWYNGEVTELDNVASEIQSQFLNGLAFHVRSGALFQDMWDVAGSVDPAGDPGYVPGEDQPFDVRDLLPAPLTQAAGWQLRQAVARRGQLELCWEPAAGAPLWIVVGHRADDRKCYQTAGPFALSYRSDDGASLDAGSKDLFGSLTAALLRNQTAVLALIENEPARP